MEYNDTSTTAYSPVLNSSGSSISGIAINLSTTESTITDMYDEPINKAVTTIAFSSVFVLCVIGNIIVLLVLTKSTQMRTRTNLFLANLAVADLFVGVFCILPAIFRYSSAQWTHGRIICKMNKFVESVNVTASMLLLELIAVERYIVIKHPLKARSLFTLYKMYFAQFFVWLVSCVYNTPYLLMWDTVTTLEQYDKELVWETNCLFLEAFRESIQIYYICSFIIWYVLPLMVMSLLYGKIARTLWKTSAQNNVFVLRKRIGSAASGDGGDTTGSTLASSQMSDPAIQSLPPGVPANCGGKCERGDASVKIGCDIAATRNSRSHATTTTHSGRQTFTWSGGGIRDAKKNGFIKPNGGSSNGKAAFLKDRHHITRSTSDSDSDENSSENLVFDNKHDDSVVRHGDVRIPTRQNGRLSTSMPASSQRSVKRSMPPSSQATEKRESQTSAVNHCRYRVTSQREASRRRVIRLLLAVLITFALLVLPNHLRLIVTSLTAVPRFFTGQAFITPVCQTLLYLNSAMNPILYCLLSQSFRQSIKEVMSCCLSWRRQREQRDLVNRVQTLRIP